MGQKRILAILFIVISSTNIFSQDEPRTIFVNINEDSVVQKDKLKKNAVYLEFLGNGGSYVSGNYERLFHPAKFPLIHFASRIGFAFSSSRGDHAAMYNIPIEINSLIGRRKHFIEVGVGWTAFIGTSNLNDTLIPKGYRTNFDYDYFFRLGYRLIASNGILLRIAPLAGLVHDPPQSPSLKFQFGFGLSFGYCFNFKKS